MNYKQTIDYLFAQLPMFQRIGAAAYKADLNNTIAICDLLGNPQHKFKSIHIAGTNGKGSSSHFLASILQSAGYKTGLYTSPHLKDFRERIKINGNLIAEDYVVNFVAKYKNDFERIKPSFFEMTVGLAFDYFANEKVDIAIIETGLGGRLDSTNIVHPLLSVITNISLDHTSLLGDTIEQIANEKAGIIKPKTPVIIGELNHKTKAVFEEKAKREKVPILFAEEEFQIRNLRQITEEQLFLSIDVYQKDSIVFSDLKTELLGLYQQKNIVTVIAATQELIRQGFNLNESHIRSGIKNVIKNTGLLGRWQILSKYPLIIADTGHNEAGIKAVLSQIAQTPHNHLHFVLGMVNDKDISTVLSLLPSSATYYFCKADIPRAMNAVELKNIAAKKGLRGNYFTSVKNALTAAKIVANTADLVFVGGSTFVVAEVL